MAKFSNSLLNLRSPLSLLRVATAGTLLGWAAQHLFWEVPYRSLLWSEFLVRIVNPHLSAQAWSAYATSLTVDSWVQRAMQAIGVFLLTTGVAALGMRVRRRGHADCSQRLLLIATGILGFVSLLLFKDAGYRIGMLMEYAAQVLSPAFLYYALTRMGKGRTLPRPHDSLLTFGLRIAVALTFVGHGLFAIGYYPIPGAFIDMTINVMGVSETQAVTFLHAAGVLDFVISIGIFIPRLARASLLYAAIWGFLTALARPVSSVLLLDDLSNLGYWSFQALLRLPHALLPIVILNVGRERARNEAPAVAQEAAESPSLLPTN